LAELAIPVAVENVPPGHARHVADVMAPSLVE
jgi:hypothetical protein